MHGRTTASAAVLALLVGALTAPAAAQTTDPPACTVTWDGGGGGSSWHDPLNWSGDAAPGGEYSAHVCIGARTSPVVFSEGVTEIASLRSDAPITVQGGDLKLPRSAVVEEPEEPVEEEPVGEEPVAGEPSTQPHAASHIERLVISGGSMSSSAMWVRDSLTWTGGNLNAGFMVEEFVVGPEGAAADRQSVVVSGAPTRLLTGAMLVNGSFTVSEEASLDTFFGEVRTTGTARVHGDVEGTWSFETGMGPDVVISPTGSVLNFPAYGRLRNAGYFNAEFKADFYAARELAAGLYAIENNGTAYVRGSTGPSGVWNQAGATMHLGGMRLDGSVRNDGTIQQTAGVWATGPGPVAGGRWVLQGDVLRVGEYVDQTAVFGDTAFEGWGDIHIEDNGVLTGDVSLDTQTTLTLTHEAALLDGATITGTGRVQWNKGSLVGGTSSTLGPGVTTIVPQGYDGTMVVPAGTALVNEGLLKPAPRAVISGDGELVNVGEVRAGECCSGSSTEASVAIEPAVVNRGLIHGVDSIIQTSGDVANSGRVRLEPTAQLHAAGAFTQTAAGTFEAVVDGTERTIVDEVIKGRAPLVRASTVALSGDMKVDAENGCMPGATLMEAGSITGSVKFESDVPECGYHLGVTSTKVLLATGDTTPPVPPVYAYPVAPDVWTQGFPYEDGWTAPFVDGVVEASPARDSGSGVQEVVEWWDTSPSSLLSASSGDLRRRTTFGHEYLTGPASNTHFYHHRAARDWAGNWSEVRHTGPFLLDVQAPSPTAVVASAPTDVKHVRNATMEVRWPISSDAQSGLADPAYQVHAAGDETNATLTNARTHRLAVTPGSRQCLVVKPYDRVGHTPTPTQQSCFIAPLNDRQFRASARWSNGKDRTYYYGTYRTTSRRGETLKRRGVQARRLWVIASTCSTCGVLDVYFNGTLHQRVRLRSATARKKVFVPVRAFSSVRRGTLKLRVASGGRRVRIQGVALQR